MAHWLRNPHFVAARGEGKCIGGTDVLASEDAATRDEAMSHMRCWVGLAQHTLNAEFPSFDLVQAMSAFDLRTRGGGAPRRRLLVIAPSLELKLRRLASAFNMPSFTA